MATGPADRPTHDALGHDHPDDEAYTDLAADLRERVDGEVRFDEYAQVLYATDGSTYQARPAGVVCPRDVDDVRAAVRVAGDHDAPILPRGAGTSLAGQTVGPGCVVLDLSVHMDGILDVDPDARRARVQPGVVQDDLDDRLGEHGLKFAPDPASSNRATIGGGIGNNSTGAHSVRYGITDAYVAELTVVLADGSVIETGDVVLDSPEWDRIVAKDDREADLYRTVRRLIEDNAAEIEARYPDLKRRVSGYNLDKVIRERETDGGTERVLNLSKLFVGAEGTLGVVVEATLDLVTKPDETAVALYLYDDLLDAMAAVPRALEFDPGAVELIDDDVVRMARDSPEYAAYAEPIPDRAEAALMLEFDSELHDDLGTVIDRATATFVGGKSLDGGAAWPDTTREGSGPAGKAFDAIEATDEETQAKLWKLRKAAIPLLMSMEGDPKPYPFVEDASVPPDRLAEYVDDFRDVLDDHDTSAAFFAHAGVGTLHIRPILNLKTDDGVETMHAIADDVTDLVVEYGGSFSGEHGDGLARTEFNPKLYGPDIWRAFKELKTAFDPGWRMNPGTVVYRDGPDDPGPDSERSVGADMRENLRYGPAYSSLEPATEQDFTDEGGFSHLVELCNGCGTCRQTGGDTMCPSYRASKEEIQTTRGRANMLRAAISGELPEEELYTERFQEEVLDLCLGCKGCKTDCPTGVDLAKLKAEVKHEYHEREGASLRERLFANVDRAAAWGSRLAPVSNWLQAAPGASAVAERLLGIAPERSLPTFRRESFVEWYADRGPGVAASAADERVVLVPGTYVNYTAPGIGKAAVEVLEAAGVHVAVPDDLRPSGRAAHSLGFLDAARERARHNVDQLAPLVGEGWSVAFLEPSDAAMIVDEYRDLLDGADVETVAAAAGGVSELIDRQRLDEGIPFDAPDEALVFHGHCNGKALRTDHHAVGVLRRAGYAVDPVDSGCCGMAGSFGYEAEHYDLSRAIGDILVDQLEAGDGDEVVAPGSSCRTQLADLRDDCRPTHPVEKLAAALAE